MTEFFKRLSLTTPRFFKDLRALLFLIAGLCGAILGLKSLGLELPEWTGNVFNWITIVSALVGAVISSLPVVDPDDIENK